MGTEKPDPLLGTLRAQGVDIRCFCQNNACLRIAMLPLAQVPASWPDALTAPQIAVRPRCSACGSRHVQTQPDWPSHMPAYRYG